MEKIKEYVTKKYPTRFENKKIEIHEEDSFFKVYVKDQSPVFLSKDLFK